jgi:hypothetical protein
LKATQAFTSWLQDSQGEKYARDLMLQRDEALKNLIAVAAISTDPMVRAHSAKLTVLHDMATFITNSRKESTSQEDE